jgi:hypothetical protein
MAFNKCPISFNLSVVFYLIPNKFVLPVLFAWPGQYINTFGSFAITHIYLWFIWRYSFKQLVHSLLFTQTFSSFAVTHNTFSSFFIAHNTFGSFIVTHKHLMHKLLLTQKFGSFVVSYTDIGCICRYLHIHCCKPILISRRMTFYWLLQPVFAHKWWL